MKGALAVSSINHDITAYQDESCSSFTKGILEAGFPGGVFKFFDRNGGLFLKAKVVEPVVIPDPYEQGVCDDDEDLYFMRLALSRDLYGLDLPTEPSEPAPPPSHQQLHHHPHSDVDTPRPFRTHTSGSARTEGYYKISHAEKSAYVAQYASRSTASEVTAKVETPAANQGVTSSRSTRANARRRAQDIEEINQVQRAMALSKGESAATELIKFNQLQTRKKHLRFARSPIHDWGLYAMEKISRG